MSERPKQKFIPKPLLIPIDEWLKRACDFVQRSHLFLLSHPDLLNQDKDRGLNEKSIRDFQIGWNPTDTFESKKLWGLPDISIEGGSRSLFLPQGIVIPSFRDGLPIRVKIRRHNWNPDDIYPKYHIIAGGTTCPGFYGNISLPILLVEAELDAMLVQQIASDCCCSLALGGVNIKPDTIVDQVLRQASTILYSLDFDDPGKKTFAFWKSAYPQMKPWPVPKGKSPGDAFALGVDIRNWIKVGLKHGKS